MEEQLHAFSNPTLYWVVSFEHKADLNAVTTDLCVSRYLNPNSQFVWLITVLTELHPFRTRRSVSKTKKAPRSFETSGNTLPTTAWSTVQTVLVAMPDLTLCHSLIRWHASTIWVEPHCHSFLRLHGVWPCTAQWSLYVPHSGHYMYRPLVTICTAQWLLYVPPV